jgi:hypothetical protein
MTARNDGREPLTKGGAYGTLYRYRVPYTDPGDPGFPPHFVWHCWAYSAEHAAYLFDDGEHADLGFKMTEWPTRVYQ